MKKVFVLLGICSLIFAEAQQPPAGRPCANNPVYRFFAFWIGDWEAFGPGNKKAGDSKIELILDSCVILENWTSTAQGYAGKSMNTFNMQTGMWQQTWIDNKGGMTEYVNSKWEKNKMIFATRNEKQKDGTFKMMRMTFTRLSDDKVRQFGESSVDEGKTWKTDFDLEYRRKKE
jgi:hypothetical protein